MMLLYSLALGAALALSAPVWGWRMFRQGRYREGLAQRLGMVPPDMAALARGRPVLWIHAVSVGEVIAASRLIDELQVALPEYLVLLSTTTPTGQQVARDRLGAAHVFYYPLDFNFAVQPWLRALRPRMLVLLESELWPRMLHACNAVGVPVVVVNARVSDRSLPRYLALRILWRPLLRWVTLLLAQSPLDAERWRSIGAPPERVRVTGNLKLDIAVAPQTPLTALLKRSLQDAQVLVAGSTHPGEEELLLRAFQDLLPGHSQLVLLLAPRHPERAGQIQALAHAQRLQIDRLSEWRLSTAPLLPGGVLLIDTVGELASLYALAAAAFVGGSLIPAGGHNPLEPARFGVPVICGPHMENFRAIFDAMRAAKAIAVARPGDLADTLSQLLGTPDGRDLGARAQAVFHAESGATARTVQALLPLLRPHQDEGAL